MTMTASALKKFSCPLPLRLDGKDGHTTGPVNPRLDRGEAGRQLSRMARRLVFERRCSFTEALREILDDPQHAVLVRAYSAPAPPIDDGLIDPAAEVHRLARLRMEKTNEDYATAARAVLDSDIDLKNAYARTYQT